MSLVIIALGIVLVSIGTVVWLLWPCSPPPPTPDEFWDEREADERARLGIEDGRTSDMLDHSNDV